MRALFMLDRTTMMAWCSVLLVQELLALAFIIAGTHGLIVDLKTPSTTDYVSFYAAGVLANTDSPQLVYDREAHYAAEQAATESGIGYVYFFYPPSYLLLCSVLARLPYVLSFIAFECGTFGLYLMAIGTVLRTRGWRWIIPVAAYPACFVAFGVGQNSFLTAALFAGATVLLPARPIMAGLLFGLLCYKPHFGILIPAALLAGQCWRAALAAGVTVLAVTGAALAAFGVGAWRAYGVAFASSQAIYESGQIPFAAYITPFGAARLLWMPPGAAYAVQLAVSGVVLVIVIWIWRREDDPAVRSAALVAGTMLAVPLALYYDLLVEMVAIAWLVRDRRDDAIPRLEKLGFIAVYAVSLATVSGSGRLSLPIGMSPALILLAICVCRSLRAHPLRQSASQASSA